jgi:hypothetical protein
VLQNISMQRISHRETFCKGRIEIEQCIFYDANEINRKALGINLRIVILNKKTGASFYYSHIIYISEEYENTLMAFSYLSTPESQRTINNIWMKFMNIKRKTHPIYEWIFTNDTLNALGNQFERYIRYSEDASKALGCNVPCCSGYSFDFFERYENGFRYLTNDTNNEYEMDPIIIE